MVARLKALPITAQTKNTFEGEKRSTIVSKAKIKVPAINPNCTDEVKCPIAEGSKLKFFTKLLITPLPANQSEVQQNCDITIIGRTNLECFIRAKLRDLLCKHN